MKVLILSAFISIGLLASTPAQKISNEINPKKIVQLSENLFSVQVFNSEGIIIQEGQYWNNDGELVPHGNWIMFNGESRDVITTAIYEKGEQVYVKTIVDGVTLEADANFLAIKRVESQIKQLEKRLANLRKDSPL